MSIISEIRCSNCGAPLEFKPGEIVATCRYCGYTVVIETGKAFTLEHSMFLNEYNQVQIDGLIFTWMRTGFLKPSDLAKKSKIIEKNLVYLPFWIIPVTATTVYKGIFERITPPLIKEGKVEKKYEWLVLARKATRFPTREYNVPLKGKIPYDFRKIENYAKVLNSEIDGKEALEIAKKEIESYHQFFVNKDVDRIIEIKTELQIGDIVYLHAPIWFITYEYKNNRYNILLDGATGTVIKGDIPTPSFSLF
jgi:DNA-directed RNA polymerase subunit RPC12/RpoP